jgi:TonB family protein
MPKKICIIYLLFAVGTLNAQGIERKFYDGDDRRVEESRSVYFKDDKETRDGDTVRSFYTVTGRPRSVEVVNKHGVRNGSMLMYHENGAVKAKGNYKSGVPTGDIISWYPNGSIQSIESFFPIEKREESGNSKLVDYYDSSGNQTVKNGGGFCECFFDIISNPKYLEKGKVVDGLRDSVWVGYRLDGKKYYEEKYINGDLQDGISFDDDGHKYSYKTLGEIAAPGDDMIAFYQHVGRALRYPKEAREKKIQGKVFVEFVVDTVGRLTDVKAIRGLGYGCDDAAVDAVKSSPLWKPGKQRGQPVRQRMVLPLSFKL